MAKLTPQEKLEKKRLLEEKREARRLAKEQKEKASAAQKSKSANSNRETVENTVDPEKCYITRLSDDALNHVLWFTTARDMGALAMTCRQFSKQLSETRASFLVSRLHRLEHKIPGMTGHINMCSNLAEARKIIEQSYGGGDTGRIRLKGKAGKEFASEFVSYARFLEEAVCGYAIQNYGGKSPTILPPFVNGRFVSVSPEHSVSRVGGGGSSGAGGSGAATWGVGKRGQLGTGKRLDESSPTMLLGGIGYGIRIVQVSAGGGLVRVAHTLLLTSTGRVLSFGTGQYGQLGHGFSGGKQLPDILRPKYIDALAGTRITCVSAGEIHSAAVSVDGDVYTWGDGFCGQLGHADKRPQVTPVQVEKGGLEDECVSHVSCGARHTLAVTEDGEVFSWGLGHFGVLGRSFTPYDHDSAAALAGIGGEEDEGMEPLPVEPPEGAPVEANPPRELGNAYNFDNLMAQLDMIANLSLTDSSDQCIPKQIDSLQGVNIIGASAGHRHTLLLDNQGSLYSCGAGISGCLGHEDNQGTCFYPMKLTYLERNNVKIMQMSAGVDMSMAISTTGDVYAWGKTDGGRIGLGLQASRVTVPRKVPLMSDGHPVKAVDVECGYVHSLIVGLNGTVHQCGEVGIDGAADGDLGDGRPVQLENFNIWHRIPEPKEMKAKQERWKKYGTYEVKGRTKMMEEE
eukprot:Nitzschia sp. Nitz4//scaffold37_size175936//167054//169102//NITZ4_002070-RA/size175936-processed-gene-0.205-mRNA-1//1//CDS//3329549860//1929//frame0